jgi:hypothetical protein
VPHPARTLLVLAGGLVALVLAGCRIPENALDGPLAIPLRIAATERSIELDAPTWYAAETSIYLCPSDPPSLPEPGPGRSLWTPGGGCHDYGRVSAPNGLKATLDVGDLTEDERPTFEAADEWHVLLVKVEGDRATAAIKSAFASPIRAAN